MYDKPKSTSPCEIRLKSLRKAVSFEGDLDVISRLKKGERIVDVCRNVRLGHSSLSTILDNADRITESAKSVTEVDKETN